MFACSKLSHAVSWRSITRASSLCTDITTRQTETREGENALWTGHSSYRQWKYICPDRRSTVQIGASRGLPTGCDPAVTYTRWFVKVKAGPGIARQPLFFLFILFQAAIVYSKRVAHCSLFSPSFSAHVSSPPVTRFFSVQFARTHHAAQQKEAEKSLHAIRFSRIQLFCQTVRRREPI